MPAAAKETETDREDWELLGVRVHPELKLRLEIEAAERRIFIIDLVHSALCKFLGRTDLLAERPDAPAKL